MEKVLTVQKLQIQVDECLRKKRNQIELPEETEAGLQTFAETFKVISHSLREQTGPNLTDSLGKITQEVLENRQRADSDRVTPYVKGIRMGWECVEETLKASV